MILDRIIMQLMSRFGSACINIRSAFQFTQVKTFPQFTILCMNNSDWIFAFASSNLLIPERWLGILFFHNMNSSFSAFLSCFSASFHSTGIIVSFLNLQSFLKHFKRGNLAANIFARNKLENSFLLTPYYSAGYFVQVKFLKTLGLIL